MKWIEQGRPFRGLITWEKAHERRMSVGDLLRAFEELAAKDDPFAYPIVYLKPRQTEPTVE